MTIIVQTKTRRQSQCPVRRQIPCRDCRKIMRSVVQSEAVAIAETPIHFNSGDEILRTETAVLRRCLQSQRPTGAEGVPELPGIAARHILGGDSVLRNIPSGEGLRKQQLELQLVIVLFAQQRVGVSVIGFNIVPLDFLQNLVGAAGVFVFDIQHGIDEMLLLQKAKTVLPAKTSKNRAVVERGLAVEINLGRPPRGCAVLELGPEGVKVVTTALR